MHCPRRSTAANLLAKCICGLILSNVRPGIVGQRMEVLGWQHHHSIHAFIVFFIAHICRIRQHCHHHPCNQPRSSMTNNILMRQLLCPGEGLGCFCIEERRQECRCCYGRCRSLQLLLFHIFPEPLSNILYHALHNFMSHCTSEETIVDLHAADVGGAAVKCGRRVQIVERCHAKIINIDVDATEARQELKPQYVGSQTIILFRQSIIVGCLIGHCACALG
mmetsp:Transcript_2847/g.6518  ORF Transcript_2847/g.6518 Transcript_2847/m.6518 type:complete len:221 (+) Transcript_2847:76-738(+)